MLEIQMQFVMPIIWQLGHTKKTSSSYHQCATRRLASNPRICRHTHTQTENGQQRTITNLCPPFFSAEVQRLMITPINSAFLQRDVRELAASEFYSELGLFIHQLPLTEMCDCLFFYSNRILLLGEPHLWWWSIYATSIVWWSATHHVFYPVIMCLFSMGNFFDKLMTWSSQSQTFYFRQIIVWLNFPRRSFCGVNESIKFMLGGCVCARTNYFSTKIEFKRRCVALHYYSTVKCSKCSFIRQFTSIAWNCYVVHLQQQQRNCTPLKEWSQNSSVKNAKLATL